MPPLDGPGERVKELTDAEYGTILALLAAPDVTERERIRASGLPPSTYHLARRRAYDAGWIADRAIPTPGALGYRCVEVVVAHPTLDGRSGLLARWQADPACGLLWAGVHAVLAVFWREDESSTPTTTHEGTTVRATPDDGAVPAYFDFGGAWARLGDRSPPTSYPRGLDLGAPSARSRDRRAAAELLTAATSEPTPLVRRPSDQRRAIDVGVVATRTLLRPAAVPAYRGRRAGELLLLTGRRRAGGDVRRTLGRLNGEAGVFPFLAADGDGSVVVAGLGGTVDRPDGRSRPRTVRGPVMPILREAVDDARLFVEPVEAIRTVVDHRYPAPAPPLGR